MHAVQQKSPHQRLYLEQQERAQKNTKSKNNDFHLLFCPIQSTIFRNRNNIQEFEK